MNGAEGIGGSLPAPQPPPPPSLARVGHHLAGRLPQNSTMGSHPHRLSLPSNSSSGHHSHPQGNKIHPPSSLKHQGSSSSSSHVKLEPKRFMLAFLLLLIFDFIAAAPTTTRSSDRSQSQQQNALGAGTGLGRRVSYDIFKEISIQCYERGFKINVKMGIIQELVTHLLDLDRHDFNPEKVDVTLIYASPECSFHTLKNGGEYLLATATSKPNSCGSEVVTTRDGRRLYGNQIQFFYEETSSDDRGSGRGRSSGANRPVAGIDYESSGSQTGDETDPAATPDAASMRRAQQQFLERIKLSRAAQQANGSSLTGSRSLTSARAFRQRASNTPFARRSFRSALPFSSENSGISSPPSHREAFDSMIQNAKKAAESDEVASGAEGRRSLLLMPITFYCDGPAPNADGASSSPYFASSHSGLIPSSSTSLSSQQMSSSRDKSMAPQLVPFVYNLRIYKNSSTPSNNIATTATTLTRLDSNDNRVFFDQPIIVQASISLEHYSMEESTPNSGTHVASISSTSSPNGSGSSSSSSPSTAPVNTHPPIGVNVDSCFLSPYSSPRILRQSSRAGTILDPALIASATIGVTKDDSQQSPRRIEPKIDLITLPGCPVWGVQYLNNMSSILQEQSLPGEERTAASQVFEFRLSEADVERVDEALMARGSRPRRKFYLHCRISACTHEKGGRSVRLSSELPFRMSACPSRDRNTCTEGFLKSQLDQTPPSTHFSYETFGPIKIIHKNYKHPRGPSSEADDEAMRPKDMDDLLKSLPPDNPAYSSQDRMLPSEHWMKNRERIKVVEVGISTMAVVGIGFVSFIIGALFVSSLWCIQARTDPRRNAIRKGRHRHSSSLSGGSAGGGSAATSAMLRQSSHSDHLHNANHLSVTQPLTRDQSPSNAHHQPLAHHDGEDDLTGSTESAHSTTGLGGADSRSFNHQNHLDSGNKLPNSTNASTNHISNHRPSRHATRDHHPQSRKSRHPIA